MNNRGNVPLDGLILSILIWIGLPLTLVVILSFSIGFYFGKKSKKFS